MCGRYSSSKPVEVYGQLFKANVGQLFVELRYNIAPTYVVLACRAMPAGRELAPLPGRHLTKMAAGDPLAIRPFCGQYHDLDDQGARQ